MSDVKVSTSWTHLHVVRASNGYTVNPDGGMGRTWVAKSAEEAMDLVARALGLMETQAAAVDMLIGMAFKARVAGEGRAAERIDEALSCWSKEFVEERKKAGQWGEE